VGMSEEVRAKCFEPYFTSKGPQGTGLGLSVCHGIVQRHGGRIAIDSLPGEGTTVRIFLPMAEEGLSAEEPVEAASLPTSRVLYIDDDPRTRAVVGDMLRSLGQEVDLAEGGARGLELFEANDYDLVITDLGMPEMDGYVVTGRIKALRPELPVAMLTGWGISETDGSMECGDVPDYVLPKPPGTQEMRALLSKLLR
jgi:CheY-like chemotaxis protein